MNFSFILHLIQSLDNFP